MQKITYAEMKAAFYQHERNSPTEHLAGYIVFTEDSFAERYSLEARTYRVIGTGTQIAVLIQKQGAVLVVIALIITSEIVGVISLYNSLVNQTVNGEPTDDISILTPNSLKTLADNC